MKRTLAQRPELIAPAGDRQCAQAAVENGADAVYFGLRDSFNARVRAPNFALEEVPELMHALHRQGVQGFVALNTLVFSDELPRLEETVRAVAAAGVDAVLVQDLGLLRLIREICPDLPIHASTQMTLTSGENLRAAEALGIDRVVLARELSVAEIAKIHQQTSLKLEAFVHGALCVAYSGQCLTSESLGGRSANRGQCAQACRMPYQLICDGREMDFDGKGGLAPFVRSTRRAVPAKGACPPCPDKKYLLSPQDLAAFDLVPELLAAGVSAFKIEGRLKTAQYVANITRHYRLAIDAALAGGRYEFSPQQVEEMEVSFSRGFSHGWLEGCNHKALVPATGSAKQGIYLGVVQGVRGEHMAVELAGAVKRGDGIALEGDRAEHTDQGGRVYEVFRAGRSLTEPVSSGVVELTFGHGALDWTAIYPGQKIWKTDDPELSRRLRKSFTGSTPQRRVALDVQVTAAVGGPLAIEARADNGAHCRLESEELLAVAIKHPLSAETLREQLGRLGKTVYELRHLEAQIDGTPMLPLSVLGRLRHEMVRLLDEAVLAPPERQLAASPVLPRLRAELLGAEDTAPVPPQLHVLCRNLEQIAVVLDCGIESLMVDFQDIRQYGQAVPAAHGRGAAILLATPRIQKPNEMGIFQVLLRHGADGILVRNLAGLAFYRQQGVAAVADFSLNAANELTVQLLQEFGAARVTVAYDLNRDQLLDLAAAAPAARLEVVVHQHMPMFHMEHCVFCAVLSPGTNKTNCGRPCDRHTVRLRDHIGMEHPLTADVGCRNTLFNAVPQSAAEPLPQLLARGIRHYRIELLDESAEAIGTTIGLYRQLLAGQISGADVWRQLRAANRVGVTRGTLEQRRNPLAIL
jgi:putative protease